MLFEHLYYDTQYQLNQIVPGEEYANAFRKPPVSPRIETIEAKESLEPGSLGSSKGMTYNFVNFESKKKNSMQPEVQQLLTTDERQQVPSSYKSSKPKMGSGPEQKINLVKQAPLPVIREKVLDASVSNMMSLTSSDDSNNLRRSDPLEKEMNLTEIEAQARVFYKQDGEVYDEIYASGVEKRLSDAYATDAGSEVVASRATRKSEIAKDRDSSEFVMEQVVRDLKRSVQETTFKTSIIETSQ